MAEAVRALPGALLAPDEGDTIYRQHDPGAHLFLIVAGYIKLTQIDHDGSERIAGILDAGELFGLHEPDGAHEDNAIAKGPSEIHRVTQHDFRGLIRQRSDLVWPLLESLTQQEVAEMVGASRPVVSAVLNQWRREDLVSYTRNYICVNDLVALRALSSD